MRLLARLRGQDSLYRVLVSGAGSSFVWRSGGYALGFLLQVITARSMSGESFGRFWYVASLMNTLALAGAFGYDTATVRFVPQYLVQSSKSALAGFLRHRARRVLTASVLISAVVIVVVLAFGARLAPELRLTFLIGSLVLPVASYASILEGSLRALKKASIAQIGLAIIRPIALIIFVALLSWTGSEIRAPVVMAGHLLAFVLAWAALNTWWRRFLPQGAADAKPDLSNSKVWASTARAMLLVTGFSLVLFQADIVLTGVFLGTTAAGHYVVGSKIASLVVFVLTAVNFIAAPMISDAFGGGRSADIRRIAYLAVRLSAIASLLLGAGLLLFGHQLLSLFGAPFADAYRPMAILVMGQLVNAVCGPVSLLLTMTGRHVVVARVLGSGAVLNVALNVLLIPNMGIAGAAVATAITNVFVNVALVVMVRRELGFVTLAALSPRRTDRRR